MPAINVLCHELADPSTNDHVRRKMLLAAHTREVDRCRQTIDEHLGKEPRVFVCNDTCDRPSSSRVFRRERCAPEEKIPAAIALERSLASERIFQPLNHHQTVQGRFTGKKSSF